MTTREFSGFLNWEPRVWEAFISKAALVFVLQSFNHKNHPVLFPVVRIHNHWAGEVYGKSLYLSQFLWEPKTALKNSLKRKIPTQSKKKKRIYNHQPQSNPTIFPWGFSIEESHFLHTFSFWRPEYHIDIKFIQGIVKGVDQKWWWWKRLQISLFGVLRTAAWEIPYSGNPKGMFQGRERVRGLQRKKLQDG